MTLASRLEFHVDPRGTLLIALPDTFSALNKTLEQAAAYLRVIVIDEAEMILDDATYRDSMPKVRFTNQKNLKSTTTRSLPTAPVRFRVLWLIE